jgi:hypothetical protein
MAHTCTQEAEIRRIVIQSQPRQIIHKILRTPLPKKALHKEGLVEWLKVQALSSNPSTANNNNNFYYHILITQSEGFHALISFTLSIILNPLSLPLLFYFLPDFL